MGFLRSKNTRVLFLLFFIILIVGIVIFFNQTNPTKLQKSYTQKQSPDEPFQEMTIPYLQGRTYESKLGELKQASENSSYTSYLTSYDSDGLNIEGLLTIPSGDQPLDGWPAIIFIHGYIPPTQYSTLTRYTDHVDYLARNGFIVFKVDLRGHGNSEGEPGGAYYSGDYIIDVLNARSALQNADFVNPKGIGLWGHSMAGNVVLRTVAIQPEIPAVAIWAGAVYTYEDWQKLRLNDNSYRPPGMSTQRNAKRQQLFDTYGEFDPNSPFWSKIPATNYLADIKSAIQLHHSKDDSVVNIDYSRNLNDILDRTSIPHEFYEYNGGGHNLTGSSFNSAMQRTVDFFKKHL